MPLRGALLEITIGVFRVGEAEAAVHCGKLLSKTRSVGTFLKARALFPAPATPENANRRQHTADEGWRASSAEPEPSREIGGRKRKQQKLLVLAVAGALRDERHHSPKVPHGLGLVLVIRIADVRLPIALGIPPGLAARRAAV